jgi:hypothetical protein
MMPALVEKAPSLYAELASGIRTNLTLDQVIRLALLAQTVPEESIQRGIIGEQDVIFGFSPDGLSILIPIPDDIRLLRDQIFADSGSLAPQTPGDANQRMIAEGARIAIHNGSKTPDLATRTAETLRLLGANVTLIDDASQPYATTTIIDHTSNPFSLRFLVDLISIRPTRIYFEYAPGSPYDIELFLGDDWAAQNKLP